MSLKNLHNCILCMSYLVHNIFYDENVAGYDIFYAYHDRIDTIYNKSNTIQYILLTNIVLYYNLCIVQKYLSEFSKNIYLKLYISFTC